MARAQSHDEDTPGPVIGIDLGTTYSVVAVKHAGKVHIIPDSSGHNTTASWVSFLPTGEILVGNEAKEAYTSNPWNTVFDAKRLIGRTLDDPAVQSDIVRFPFHVVDRKGGPVIQIQLRESGGSWLRKGPVIGEFTPQQIGAKILAKLKKQAETYIGEKVTRAVLTVPAYFNDAQRQATREAGALAGLQVLRIINEPTAASLAYGFDKQGGERNVLVYDLGGGTLDVSLLNIDDGVHEVLATTGDTHFGGEDFDNRIIDHLLRQFELSASSPHPPSPDDPVQHPISATTHPDAMSRLKAAAEAAKRALSSEVETLVEINDFVNSRDLRVSLTRKEFEKMNEDLFDKALDPVKRVLEDAKLKISNIDEIVLVGGSTRIPRIRQILQGYFGKEPVTGIDPDLTVAHGAALQGAVLAGDVDMADILVHDVIPLTLGIETTGGVYNRIITRNSVVPTRKTKVFTADADDKTSVLIRIYEGEHSLVKRNNLLGEFELSGIAPAPKGVPQIEVTFEVNADGIFQVTAVDKASSSSKSLTVIDNPNRRLTVDEIERMVREAEEYELIGQASERVRQARLRDLEQYIDRSLKLFATEEPLRKPWPHDQNELLMELALAEEWAAYEGQDASLGELTSRLKHLQERVEFVMGGHRFSDEL